MRRLSLTVLIFALGTGSVLPAAERPSAMKLFPQDTLLFVRLANAREFGLKVKETSTGRMFADPQLAPFVEKLYGGTADMYSDKLEESLGISWDELQELPTGEVALGIVARPAKLPAFLLLVDQGTEPSSARRLLDRAIEAAQERGGELTTEKIDGVEVTVIRDGDNQDRMFGMFERDNTIVVATDANVLRGVLHHWEGDPTGAGAAGAAGNLQGESGESAAEEAATGEEEEFVPGLALAENYQFTSILRNCRRPQDPPPQLIAFIDPIGLLHEFSRDNPGAQFGLSYLPQLGLDGILGIGGALTLATGDFDDLTHVHVLLENPRSGLLEIIQFDQGETAPEAFVPRSVESYFTWSMNFPATYDRIVAMSDTVIGEGRFEDGINSRVNEPLGIDFAADIIDNLGGRASMLIGYEKPARMQSRKHVLTLSLVDEAKAAETLQAIIDRFPDQFEERQFGAATYYAIGRPNPDQPVEERPFDPFVAIMDGYLLIGGATQVFEQCVMARDGTAERLVDSSDYQRIVATLGRETPGQAPAFFSLQRSEESFRHLYDLLTSEKSREFIEENAADNAFLTALLDALENNELPPFEVLQQYMGPGGGIVYDTDSGYHGISFSLRGEGAQ